MIGDKIGRKPGLIITLWMMGGATVLIGCLPTQETWGLAAPFCLIVLRIVQGLGISGEWGGALLMAVESSNKTTRSLFGSIPQMGVPIGLLLGTLALNLMVHIVPDDDFLKLGWRVPFIASALLLVIGVWIRSSVSETPEFQEVKNSGKEVKVPIVDLLKYHWKSVILAIGIKCAETAPFYIITTFVVSYVTITLELPKTVVLSAISLSMVVCTLMIPVMGVLADKVGRKRMYVIGVFSMMLFAFPYYMLLNTKETALIALATVLGVGIIWAPTTATLGTLSADLFPAEVRYTGVTVGYQVGAAIFSGTAPLIALALLTTYQSWVPISVYITILCAISLITVAFMKSKKTTG